MSFLNGFALKKYAGLMIAGVVPTLAFFVTLQIEGNVLIASVAFAVSLVISMLIGAKIQSNPWQSALEGKGLLVGSLDSSGIIKTYLAKVNLPFLNTVIDGNKKTTIFDRAQMLVLKKPGKAVIDESETELKFTLAKDKFAQSIFSFDGMPFLLYNKTLGDFFNKELLSTMEKNLFVEHTILYLTRRIEDLSSKVRDFARYIVEQTRPKQSLLSGKLFWVIMIIVIIIVIALGWPILEKAIGGVTASAGAGLPTSMVNPK